jgi:methyl-accepting chemotaxis protein
MLIARGRDARAPMQQIRDTLERAKLVALNAGLEGARIGDPVGKALVSVADEQRALASRALDALDELAEMLVRTEEDREKLLQRIEEARDRARELADELLRSQAAQRDSETALAELGKLLGKTTSTDPETARALTQAAEHARGLLGALTLLSNRRDRGVVRGALGPALRPLLSALRELYRGRPRDEQP